MQSCEEIAELLKKQLSETLNCLDSKSTEQTKPNSFGGPAKNLRGPAPVRGPAVKNHWSKPYSFSLTTIRIAGKISFSLNFTIIFTQGFIECNSYPFSTKHAKCITIQMHYNAINTMSIDKLI